MAPLAARVLATLLSFNSNYSVATITTAATAETTTTTCLVPPIRVEWVFESDDNYHYIILIK